MAIRWKVALGASWLACAGVACDSSGDEPGDDPLSIPASEAEAPEAEDAETVPLTTERSAESDPGDAVTLACPDVVEESRYCLTSDYGTMYVAGLDSGTLCPVTGVDGDLFGYSTAAWLGDDAVTCDILGTAEVIDLATGDVANTAIPCVSATNWRGGILVLTDMTTDKLLYFRNVDEVLANAPYAAFYAEGMHASRIAGDGLRLFAAWHSDSLLQTFNVTAEEQGPDLNLEDFDGWFHGLSVVDGHVFVLTTFDEWYEFAGGEVVASGDWYSGFGAGSMNIFTCQAR